MAMSTIDIRLVDQARECDAAFDVLVHLRPALERASFAARLSAQIDAGYTLALAWNEAEAVGAAGYRFCANLAWGHHCYIDDLVTRHHGQGVGRALMAWVIDDARRHGCGELHLDSGVQRFAAHRFYLNGGMQIASHHFSMVL